MVRERKSTLKMKRVAVEATSTKRKDATKHRAIASKNNPVTKRLFLRSIGCSPSFSAVGKIVEVDSEINSRSQFSFKICGVSIVIREETKVRKNSDVHCGFSLLRTTLSITLQRT